MPITTMPRLAAAALAGLVGIMPAAAQQLENSTTKATSGTNGQGTQGRASGANLSAGSGGPASETTMPPRNGLQTGTPAKGGTPAGGEDATRELFQH